jgi:N-acetylmuramoyl-L-alanine amidase
MIPYPTNFSSHGNSRQEEILSATASAAFRFRLRDNAEFKTSLVFAELLAKEMKAQGLQYARQYSQPIMGHYQHPLLNKETGVYSYDELIVLKSTRMPAVLLEAGSIINRDEELKMNSTSGGTSSAAAFAATAREFCDFRWGIRGPL